MASEKDSFEPAPGAKPGGEQQVLLEDPYDFSVVLGGPLYQLIRRAHLAEGALDLLRRSSSSPSLRGCRCSFCRPSADRPGATRFRCPS